MSEENKKEITWTSPEFEFFEKDILWYGASLFISFLLIVFAIWQQNILFTVFIVVAESVLLFFGSEQPRDVEFHATAHGLEFGRKFYSWSQFESFSVSLEKNPKYSDLHFHKENNFGLDLKIDIETEDVAKIRSFMHNYLTEIEHKDSLTDSISRLLRL